MNKISPFSKGNPAENQYLPSIFNTESARILLDHEIRGKISI